LTFQKFKSIFADTWALSLTIKEIGMVHDCLRRLYLKLHQLIRREELFCFSYSVKLKAYFTGACPARPVECETYSSGVGQNDRTGVNSFSACLLAKSDRIGGDRLDLLHRDGVIPLGLAPWNETCPIKHLPFRSIATSFGQNLYHRGKVIPLGIGHSLNRYPIKLHQLTLRVELFYFAWGSLILQLLFTVGNNVIFITSPFKSIDVRKD